MRSGHLPEVYRDGSGRPTLTHSCQAFGCQFNIYTL